MDNIEELLTRGVDSIYPSKEDLEKALRSGKKLRLYQGFDPTGTQLHLGHMVGLRKLSQWQKLGHHVIFLIGDGTVQAGDPSGKTTARIQKHVLIIGTKEDKPGILRQIAEVFELENVNMTAIDSYKVGGGVRFRINVDKKAPAKIIDKVIRLLTNQGFSVNSEFRENAKSYVEQAKKIVNFKGKNPVEILYNGDWLNELNLIDVLNIAEHFTLQQLAERDLFQKRIKKGEDVNLREFLYPLLQGYDSVAMDVDLELGGTDQMFNMLAGRKLVKEYLNKDKFVMTTPLLTDSQGAKIGKTEGNVIALTDEPEELFGKIMALPDDVTAKAFEYLTDVPLEEVKRIEQHIKEGENPLEYKKRLALEIVKQLHGEKDAEKAQKTFENVVQKKEIPTEIPEVSYNGEPLVDFLVEANLASSKSDARRLIEQGGVEVDNIKVENTDILNLKDGSIVRVGKRKFVKIKTAS